jgi:tetratricopeptide (TPR) repeat protein
MFLFAEFSSTEGDAMMQLHLNRLVLAASLVPFLAASALAAGTAPSAPEPSKPTVTSKPKPRPCAKYKKTSKAYKKCVKQYASLFDDEELYATGYALAKDDAEYGDAIAVLAAMHNQNDARALTMIGYSMRKSGDISGAFDYYNRALTIDANNVNTREYLGEAFLQKGDVGSAKAQLVEIANRCGPTCEAYVDLDQNIKAFAAKSL